MAKEAAIKSPQKEHPLTAFSAGRGFSLRQAAAGASGPADPKAAVKKFGETLMKHLDKPKRLLQPSVASSGTGRHPKAA
jgi:hypothetical protein